MIEPKTYKVRDDATETKIVNSGFANRGDYYIMRKMLYEKTIAMSILIDKYDRYIVVNVRDQNTGHPYTPFYNSEDRYNDLVYEAVCKKYNQIIDRLVAKEVFEYEENKNMKELKSVKIKKLKDYAKLPTRGSEYAAGYDLCACIDKQVKIKPGEVAKIGTGLAMELPSGYFGAIFARSGLATKQGLKPANCVGVCDEDYTGEYIVALHNTSSQVQVVHNGDRIAQLVLLPYENIEFIVCDELTDTDRGAGGFGSTGKN